MQIESDNLYIYVYNWHVGRFSVPVPYQDVLFRESFDVLVGSLFDSLVYPQNKGKQVM